MPVDPSKPRRILVVHGVSTGSDADQKQDKQLHDLLIDRLNGIPVPFETALFRYEDLNDEALGAVHSLFEWLKSALLAQNMLGQLAADAGMSIVDVVGDVLVEKRNGPTAKAIRDGLRSAILDSYESGYPLYLVAHSLGSLYAFDVVQELMATDGLFMRDKRRTWPVQALVSMGSPIGLRMFANERKLHDLGQGRKLFRWQNFWSRTDPVVSGSFYGASIEGYEVAQRFLDPRQSQGWIVHDHVVDTGFAWLLAHTSYWKSSEFGDALIHLITT
jgi:hypothetical protein